MGVYCRSTQAGLWMAGPDTPVLQVHCAETVRRKGAGGASPNTLVRGGNVEKGPQVLARPALAGLFLGTSNHGIPVCVQAQKGKGPGPRAGANSADCGPRLLIIIIIVHMSRGHGLLRTPRRHRRTSMCFYVWVALLFRLGLCSLSAKGVLSLCTQIPSQTA